VDWDGRIEAVTGQGAEIGTSVPTQAAGGWCSAAGCWSLEAGAGRCAA